MSREAAVNGCEFPHRRRPGPRTFSRPPPFREIPMPPLARALSVVAALAILPSHADPIIGSFAPQYPAIFAPINQLGEPVLVRALTDWGVAAAGGAEVRIDATCGEF